MADRACVVVLERGRMLMVRQTYAGETFWTFPGGSIQPDETPEAAAAREVKEETGLGVEIAGLLCRTSRAPRAGTYYCYLGRILGGRAALGSDPELPMDAQQLHELRWFDLDEMRDHPEVARIWAQIAVLSAPGGDGAH